MLTRQACSLTGIIYLITQCQNLETLKLESLSFHAKRLDNLLSWLTLGKMFCCVIEDISPVF